MCHHKQTRDFFLKSPSECTLASAALLKMSCLYRAHGRGSRKGPITMMPIGTPRVPYRTPGEGGWQWVDIWNVLVSFLRPERVLPPVQWQATELLQSAPKGIQPSSRFCVTCQLIPNGPSVQNGMHHLSIGTFERCQLRLLASSNRVVMNRQYVPVWMRVCLPVVRNLPAHNLVCHVLCGPLARLE